MEEGPQRRVLSRSASAAAIAGRSEAKEPLQARERRAAGRDWEGQRWQPFPCFFERKKNDSRFLAAAGIRHAPEGGRTLFLFRYETNLLISPGIKR